MSLKTDEKDPAQTTQQTEETTEQGNTSTDGLPQSQAELDALIEKRLARERKKFAATPPAQPQSTNQETNQETQSKQAQPQVDNIALQENLALKAQISALKSGVLPTAVEDAVYLAIKGAQDKGELDQEGVEDALKEVLKRHPEWKKSDDDKKKGSFKIGASNDQTQQTKSALPTGTVIL